MKGQRNNKFFTNLYGVEPNPNTVGIDPDFRVDPNLANLNRVRLGPETYSLLKNPHLVVKGSTDAQNVQKSVKNLHAKLPKYNPLMSRSLPIPEWEMQAPDICAFCLEELNYYENGEGEVTTAPCGHSFHKDCLNRYISHASEEIYKTGLNIRKNIQCPLCQGTIATVEVKQNTNKAKQLANLDGNLGELHRMLGNPANWLGPRTNRT